MATFSKDLPEILLDEGIWSKTPGDSGLETAFGIDMASNPTWEGWPLVHQLLAAQVARKDWPSNVELMAMVTKYYRAIWDHLLLDQMPDEPMAMSLFGGVINQGLYRCVVWLQTSLNSIDHDVVVDGNFGAGTLAAVNAADQKWLLELFQTMRKAAYITTAAHQPNDRQFLRGWVNRLNSGA